MNLCSRKEKAEEDSDHIDEGAGQATGKSTPEPKAKRGGNVPAAAAISQVMEQQQQQQQQQPGNKYCNHFKEYRHYSHCNHIVNTS